jgi:two-component system chemotaxis sensor kinase CheA
MDNKDDEFIKRIKETFRIEAEEHLNAFTSCLIDLEKPQSQERYSEIIESMFRDIHSLKGAARSVDQRDVESVCQPLESVFSGLKSRGLTLSPASIDLFYRTVESLVKLIKVAGSGITSVDREINRDLIRELNDISAGGLKKSEIVEPKHIKEGAKVKPILVPSVENQSLSDIPKKERPLFTETVRISITKLNQLLLQAEELTQSKKAINQHLKELKEISFSFSGFKADSLKRNKTHSAESLAIQKEMSEGNKSFLNKLESQLSYLNSSMEKDHYSFESIVDTHLEALRQVLMLPVSSIVAAFPGMVREISREQKKEIELIIKGEELEIDKRILEELKDPLIHLLRNSIDHGISKPDERISNNKPAKGTINLLFTTCENGMIKISLSDDGIGIDKEKVVKAAIKSGILSAETAVILEPDEILKLIYQSGVSTSSIITDISGRGLGLSIVHEKVEKLNGKIWVETELNKGTTFHIILPMTLSTFRGIMVRISEFLFILPTVNVERVIKLDRVLIKTVKNNETIVVDHQIHQLLDLGEVLELAEHNYTGSAAEVGESGNENLMGIIVLASGENRIAFKVDEVIDEQQVLVKSLGKLLKRVKNISGATVLGSGRVVPVLHIPDLFKSALSSASKTKSQTSSSKKIERVKRILVADDSITSRTLIKNILETAGYQVLTAVDGTDAFTIARTNEFDLIVSDVDMPRMNGFELITKIRHDKKLSEVPVILITALGSQDDREHGIEVGADAYIIKSSFDQDNLLEIVKKLI